MLQVTLIIRLLIYFKYCMYIYLLFGVTVQDLTLHYQSPAPASCTEFSQVIIPQLTKSRSPHYSLDMSQPTKIGASSMIATCDGSIYSTVLRRF